MLILSKELILQRTGNGVELVKPEEKNHSNSPSIADLFSFPSNVYFLNTNSEYLDANETAIQSNGFTSLQSAVGKTIRVVAEKQAATNIINNDKNVIIQNRFIISEERFIREDNAEFHTLSVKFPWYEKNKIIGLFGCSMFISSNPELPINTNLANPLSTLVQTGLLSSMFPITSNYCSYLSQREIEIMNLVVKGKTAKEIAKIFNRSPRTVEHQLENIKIKMKVSSRSEMIEFFLSH